MRPSCSCVVLYTCTHLTHQTIIGSRYGHQAPPTRIEQLEMETIVDIAQSIGIPGNNLLTEWYTLDMNALPQQYVLSVRPSASLVATTCEFSSHAALIYMLIS